MFQVIGEMQWTGGSNNGGFAYPLADVYNLGQGNGAAAPGPNWSLQRVIFSISISNHLTGTTGEPVKDWFFNQGIHVLAWWDPTGVGSDPTMFPIGVAPGDKRVVAFVKLRPVVYELVHGNPNYSTVSWEHEPSEIDTICPRPGNPVGGATPAVFINLSTPITSIGTGPFVCCATPTSHAACASYGGTATYKSYQDLFCRALWRQDS